MASNSLFHSDPEHDHFRNSLDLPKCTIGRLKNVDTLKRSGLPNLFPGPGSNLKMAYDDAVGPGCFVADPLNERLDADLLGGRHSQAFHLGQKGRDESFEPVQPRSVCGRAADGRFQSHRRRSQTGAYKSPVQLRPHMRFRSMAAHRGGAPLTGLVEGWNRWE